MIMCHQNYIITLSHPIITVSTVISSSEKNLPLNAIARVLNINKFRLKAKQFFLQKCFREKNVKLHEQFRSVTHLARRVTSITRLTRVRDKIRYLSREIDRSIKN